MSGNLMRTGVAALVCAVNLVKTVLLLPLFYCVLYYLDLASVG